MMGAERRSMVMTEDEKKMTAYHEAGHALVALHEPASDPIHKATIIPRGRALGMVMRLPERDNTVLSPRQDVRQPLRRDGRPRRRRDRLRLRQGHFRRVVRHQDGDLLARDMVTQWGMSDKLGPLAYGENEEEVFLGYSIAQTRICRTRRRPGRRGNSPHRRRGLRGRRARFFREYRRAAHARRGCSNTRRCRATRSRTCSRASPRCASS